MGFRKIEIVAASLALALVALHPVSALKFYGNWCGPLHPDDPSQAPDPIDAVDAACKKHDLAYEANKGIPSGDDLVDLLKSGDLEDKEFASAVIMATFFSGMQKVTVITDVAQGKVSSVVKVTGATVKASIVVPASVTEKLLRETSKEMGEAGQALVDVVVEAPEGVIQAIPAIVEVPLEVIQQLPKAVIKDAPNGVSGGLADVFGW